MGGSGPVMHGEYGVDLSALKSTIKAVDRPLDRSFASIHKWLERGLHINPETQLLTVQTLTNWDTGVWELMLIQNTEEWKHYMQAALDRGWFLAMLVEIYNKPQFAVVADEGQVSASAPLNEEPEAQEAEEAEDDDEPKGVADEGERIPAIVEQMEEEDREAAEVDEVEDYSDDEGYTVPAEWEERGFGNPVIQDAKHEDWQYRANEVVQGARYKSIDEVKEAVKRWSISLRKEFKVVKSGSKEYDVKCVKDDCPWRVHAYKGRWKTHWECSIVTEHTCYAGGVEQTHRNITSAFIARHMYGLIIDRMDYEPKLMISHIEQTFHYTISYVKAWRAKQKVFEMRFGTYEASYDNLPTMLAKIVGRNHGSAYDIYQLPSTGPGPSILQRAFFCLGGCVKAFQYCPLCSASTALS